MATYNQTCNTAINILTAKEINVEIEKLICNTESILSKKIVKVINTNTNTNTNFKRLYSIILNAVIECNIINNTNIFNIKNIFSDDTKVKIFYDEGNKMDIFEKQVSEEYTISVDFSENLTSIDSIVVTAYAANVDVTADVIDSSTINVNAVSIKVIGGLENRSYLISVVAVSSGETYQHNVMMKVTK